MRFVLIEFLLVLASCGAAAEVPATTTSIESASTTTTAQAATTSEATTTTTTEPPCVEREGVFYDSRGFVCPPHMKQGKDLADSARYLPGTYTTRIFEPRFSFTRDGRFTSGGENGLLVVVQETANCQNPECFQAIYVYSPEVAEDLRAFRFDTLDWPRNLAISSVEYWGKPGTQINFVVGSCPTAGCAVNIESLPGAYGWSEGDQVTLLIIDVADGPIGFEITSHKSRFDAFVSEVADPVVQSIQFIDG